jgi:branched-chain amino acid aminotransferase
MTGSLAYLNGEFVPASQLVISAEDLGFVQGVAVSERLRTFRGTVFRLDEHLKRLDNSLRLIDLSPGMSLTRIGEVVVELADRNYPALTQGDDLGLALFVTPGTLTDRQPTIGIQAFPLPFGQWADYYTAGQSLTETGIRQVPACCWPPELKCRSRMHYFLADRLANQRYPGSRAVLLDLDGFVSEASTANVLIYRDDEGLVSPPREKILPGVSLSVVAELADDLGIPMRFNDVRLDECETADEILLCSTSPCVWPVVRCNGRPVGRGPRGQVFRRLLSAWSERVGVDIAGQALRFSFRK